MSSKDIVVLDLETTGLDFRNHVPWEFFAARCRIDQEAESITITDYLHLHLGLTEQEQNAHDSVAREMTRFDDRYGVELEVTDPKQAVPLILDLFGSGGPGTLAPMNERPHVVGAIPSFDTLRLGTFIGRHANTYYGSLLVEPWHYHLVCIENLLSARTFHLPPWKSHDMSREIGVVNDETAEHTSRGDVIWTLDSFASVFDLTISNRELITDG